MDQKSEHDVLVIGGSFAGISAALQLARARRTVVVVDGGVRRNRFAAHAHGFLGQDGRPPAAIVEEARRQLLAYPTIEWLTGNVVAARQPHAERFTAELADGSEASARRLILALGVTDTLPDIAGLEERWGRGVFHCPYCHGYELGGGPVGVLAVGPASLHHALLLPDWGPTTFFTNGAIELSADDRRALADRGVVIEPTGVEEVVEGASVRLGDGRVVELSGLFVAPRTEPSGPVAQQVGCALEEGPMGSFVAVDPIQRTSVPGVFACGDAARAAGSIALAVGDGARAGASAHQSLVFGM